MTGIVVAFAGINATNLTYANGLYNTTLSLVDTTPITASATSQFGATSVNYTWIGYYRANTTGSVSLSLACPYQEIVDGSFSPWGGGGSSVGRLWFGSNAVSGFNNSNANITATNTTASASVSVVSGTYYALRINWQTSLPYDSDFFDDYWATSSITFLSSGSSNVNALVWYNSRTNGF